MTRYADMCRGATPMSSAQTMHSENPIAAGLAGSGLGFECRVPPDGYRWWYVDGFSDCGRYGVTVIAFIGSVFSPYYFRARSRGQTEAENHVSLNVILYGPHHARWCMTERGRSSLRQAPERLDIGLSSVQQTERGLRIEINERATPWPRRVIGNIEVNCEPQREQCFQLDDRGEHWWWPIAALGSITVDMDQPALRWQGGAYVDSNFGARPIETGFTSWNWCRGHVAGRGVQIHYDAQLREGGEKQLSLAASADGLLQRIASPSLTQLPPGPIWRVARPARLGFEDEANVTTLEDTPFYTRSRIDARYDSDTYFMHESLDLDRFRRPLVQALLPFRMPRRGNG